jgi:hypothetical protein
VRSRSKWWNIGLYAALAAALLLVRYKGVLFTKVHPAVKYLESQRISHGIADFQLLEDDYFSIRHDTEDGAAAELVRSIAGEWGSQVLDFFDYRPSDKIEVVMFSREEDLKGVLRIPQGQSATGAYSGGMINLLSPASLRGMNQDPDSLVNVFVHELAHLALDGICRGNYPLWFTEGSALYLEYTLLDYEWGSGLPEEPSYSMEDLTYRFNALDEHKAYRQSFLLVKGLIREHGREAYLDFLHSLGEGRNFKDALLDSFGATEDKLADYLK